MKIEEAIEKVNKIITTKFNNDYSIDNVDKEAIEIILSMLEEKDEIIKNIIKRLDNDIKRITETKAEGCTDDYRRCRLKAYRTKTKEIKEYIEEQYFENKSKELLNK